MITKAWKVYGLKGHRQKISFGDSVKYDFSENGKTRMIELLCSDKTKTNEYCILRITMDTSEQCIHELNGQISDGIFENARVGNIEEIY